ncbi:MAG: hypothetical protein IJH35_02420 [Methanobrevibacter sp.]|nr:hypothetical protein [Methanobrevibacter sp.]
MSLEKNKENNEKNNNEKYEEDMYVKNSVDYSSNESYYLSGDWEDEDQIDFEENDLNELALLHFFNDFALLDIGIHDLIREIYFED